MHPNDAADYLDELVPVEAPDERVSDAADQSPKVKGAAEGPKVLVHHVGWAVTQTEPIGLGAAPPLPQVQDGLVHEQELVDLEHIRRDPGSR